jgi:hypothetical protein
MDHPATIALIAQSVLVRSTNARIETIARWDTPLLLIGALT